MHASADPVAPRGRCRRHPAYITALCRDDRRSRGYERVVSQRHPYRSFLHAFENLGGSAGRHAERLGRVQRLVHGKSLAEHARDRLGVLGRGSANEGVFHECVCTTLTERGILIANG